MKRPRTAWSWRHLGQLTALFCLLALVSAGAWALDLDAGWEYRWGDSPFDAAGVPLWTQAPEEDAWSPIGFPSNPPGRAGRQNAWFRVTLPEGEWRDPVLYIFSVDIIVQVYLEGRLLYEYGHFDAEGKGRFVGWPWHMISLPTDCAGKELYFRVFSDYMDIGLWGEVRILERQELLGDIVTKSLDRLISSGFSLLIALLALVFALLQRDHRTFGAIAFFALVSGTMVLSGAQANLLILNQPLLWDYLGASSYFLVPVAMVSLLSIWVYPAYTWLFKLIRRVHLAYVVGALTLALSGVVSLASTYPPFDYLLTLTLPVLLVPVVHFLPKANADQRLILAAYAILSLLLLLDMAVAHSWLPWGRIPLAWGTLAFSLAVVLVALHHYGRTQEELREMNLRLEQRVRQRTKELERLARVETERARLLEIENRKRGELEDLIGALHECSQPRAGLELLSTRLPALCDFAAGAFYRFNQKTSDYERLAIWGALDTPEHLGSKPEEAARIEETNHREPGSLWRLVIEADDPKQGRRPLGLLLLLPPHDDESERSANSRLLWRRLAERGVERINLTLSQLSLREALRAWSYEDGLSGLKNRRFLDEALPREMALARERGQALSLIICDIDYFKRFNDAHGHDAGDAAIRHVARHLKAVFRESDSVCRYGGEEFVVMLPGAKAEDGVRLADWLRQSVATDPIEHGEERLGPVTLSAGIASWPQDVESIEDLLIQADQALYRAKQGGRNRVERAGQAPSA